MSQRRKSLRLAEKEKNGKKNTGEAKSGSSSFGVVSRPVETLVFETVIPLFKDVELLKLCRLVSKEWNSLACPRLRAISNTYVVQERSLTQPDGLGLSALKCLVENRNSGLPSAFQNFHICVRSFTGESFWSLVEYIMQQEDLFVSELTLIMDGEGWNQRNERLPSFLMSNRNNEKLVRMKIFGSLISNLDVFPHDQIRFPHLKEIEWVDIQAVDCEADMLFFKNMLLHSPLETMRLDFFAKTGIQGLFRSGSVGYVTRLFIRCDCKVLPEDWDHFSRLRMPKLRELGFEITDVRCARDHSGYAHHLAAMLSNAAETVEFFRGTFIPFEMLSTFPKLREIQCQMWGTEFLEVTAERFPSLKSITFLVTMASCRFGRSVCPHFGVERIELSVIQESGVAQWDPKDRAYQDLLHRALRCTSSQFPNVVELKLGSYVKLLTSPLVATMHDCFPRLKVLDFWEMEADFETLSGYQVNVENWLGFGFPLEIAPRQCSLQNFENLEKVTLGEKISVSEHLVKHCLSKVVKLKSLEFKWEEELLPETIRDYLGHVELIRISRCSFFKKKTLEEKDRILEMLPGVFIDHK